MTLTLRPNGVARTPYGETRQIPKGPDARHEAEGRLEIAPEFEAGRVPADTLKRGWLDEAEARRAGGASRQS